MTHRECAATNKMNHFDVTPSYMNKLLIRIKAHSNYYEKISRRNSLQKTNNTHTAQIHTRCDHKLIEKKSCVEILRVITQQGRGK